MRRVFGWSSVCGLFVGMASASAQTEPAPEPPPTQSLPGITVTATRLDDARNSIQPSLGASRYDFTRGVIDTPLGEQAPLNQVLLRAPGVAQDGFGQVHVRGDHGNLQYRLDGVQLPEGLALFARCCRRNTPTVADDRRAAGAVRLPHRRHRRHHRKSGTTDPGAEATMIGGSRNYLRPPHLRRPLGRNRLFRSRPVYP